MKKAILCFTIASAMFFTACKKEGQTIINNYNNGNETTDAPKRKMMTEYGNKDGSYTLKMSYFNAEIGKLQELTSYSSGVANSKIVILYDNTGKPNGYQSYTLPANTLNNQGSFILDNKGRIIKVVNREVNADTISIISLSYIDLDYQPASMNYYSKYEDKITSYAYFNYDSKGNLYSQTEYAYNNSTLYKKTEVTASGFSNAINPLNQLYYYLIISGSSTSAPQYFSNYFGNSTRIQYYQPNGDNDGADIYDYTVETDEDNYVTSINASGQEIVIKY